MKVNLGVDIHHLTRVEGHGNIRVRVEEGEVVEARWDIVETPRFFEVMLKGKHYTSAAILTARICGICSIGHALASLRATERAFGVEIPPVATKLRLLAKHGETLQSHYLHLFFLAAPDFLDLPSVLPLIESKPEVVHMARKLKGLANRICDAVAGRTTHPVSLQPGGVAARPSAAHLGALRSQLLASLDDLEGPVLELFRSFEMPDFWRETEFVSLKVDGEYPFIGGRLASSDGVNRSEDEYLEMTNEYVTEDNTSKWCKLSRQAFAVGALARFNNNHRHLQPRARRVAEMLQLHPVSHNPFMNNVAQLVECVHATLESIRLIEEIVDEVERAELMSPVKPRAGKGVGAVEVPRGILYHCYEYGKDGRVIRADCVIPTTQNNANIHLDMISLARQFAAEEGMTDDRLALLCSMLVRAYDPCISCSVH